MGSIPIYLVILFFVTSPKLIKTISSDKLLLSMLGVLVSIILTLTMSGYYSYNISNYVLLISVIFFLPLLKISQNRLNNKQKNIITFLVITVITITAITTIMGLEIYPNATRMYAISTSIYGIREGVAITSLYRKLGIADYSVTYSFAILFPLFIYLARINKSKNRKLYILYVIVSLIVFYAVFKASVVIILISILFSAILLIYTKNIKYSIIMLIILSVLSLYIFKPLFVDLLQFIANKNIGNNIVSLKAAAISDNLTFEKEEGGIYSRTVLYMLSLKTFLQNPIFGGGKYGVYGGHSIILDFIAYYGMFITVPVFILISSFYKRYCSILTGYSKFTYQVAFLSFVFISIAKGGSTFAFFFSILYIVPFLLIHQQKKQIRHNISPN